MLDRVRGGALKRIAIVLALMAAMAGQMSGRASALQIGAAANGSTYVVAARSTIYKPSVFENGGVPRAYWLGIVFPDGAFFQAGWWDSENGGNGQCQSGFSTFVEAIVNGSTPWPGHMYNIGNCPLTGSERTFKMAVLDSNSTKVVWQFYMSGNAIGPSLTLPSVDSRFLRSNTDTLTELVGGESGPMPSTNYAPAIEFLDAGSSTWAVDANANAVTTSDLYNSSGACKYFLVVNAANDFTTGEQSEIHNPVCPQRGDKLW